MIAFFAFLLAPAPVTLVDQGTKVVLSNGLVRFAVDKDTATIPDMRLGDSPNLAGKGAYFAVANSVGEDGWDIKNGSFRVVRTTPELVEVSIKAPIGGCDFDQRYVLRKGDPGFYVYVVMSRGKGYPPENFGQVRWSFYLNPDLFDYQLVNDRVQAPIPDMTGAEQVQDATYRLRNGQVYTKYNYVDYVENHFVHGLTRHDGGYGAFIVMGSNEYLGGPNKQYLTVHSGPIMHRFLHSGHFLPRGIAHPALPDDWSKLCGPWFVFLNRGNSVRQVWDDAKRRSGRERREWPYAWMQDPEYPIRRGGVHGSVTLGGRKPGANALVVLTPVTSDWQVQILGYNFSTRADGRGRFLLAKVRPGRYQLTAWAPGSTEEIRREDVVVGEGGDTDLGVLDIPMTDERSVIWRIGEADRTTAGFKLSDHPRQYGLDAQVPAELTYVVGKSRPVSDWYYAQAKPGEWKVIFDLANRPRQSLTLTLGIAGQTNDPRLEVLVNGQPVGFVTTAGNSSALYRSAILSSSYYEVREVTVPVEALEAGINTLTLRLTKGSIMYDVVELSSSKRRL